MKKLLFLFTGVLLFANYVFSQDLTVCGNSVELSADVENYSDFSWNCAVAGTFSNVNSLNTTFTLDSSVNVQIYLDVNFYYIATVNGNMFSDTIQVRFLQKPNPNAGADDVVCGNGGEITGVCGLSPTDGYTPVRMWTVVEKPNPGAMVTWGNDLPTGITGDVHVSDFGIYTFIFKEINTTDDAMTCFGCDTVTIEFLSIPAVNVGPDLFICGQDFSLNATSSHVEGDNITGIWQCTSGGEVEYADQTDPHTTAHYSSYGPATFRWIETNHPQIDIENPAACASYDELTVTFYEVPMVNFVVHEIEDLVAPNARVVFENTTNYVGIANAVCEWHFGDESVENSCNQFVEHVYNAPDCYEPYLVVYNDVSQCQSIARLDDCLSIAGITDYNVTDINIYPSPVTDFLNITSSETISSIEVVNIMGQVVCRAEVNSDNAVCNVEGLANGVYVVRISHLDKLSERKFVKE